MDSEYHEDAQINLMDKYNIKASTYDENELIKFAAIVEGFVSSNKAKEYVRQSNRLCLIRFLKAFGSHERAFEAWLISVEWSKEFDVVSLDMSHRDISLEHSLGRYLPTDCFDVCGRPVSISFPKNHASDGSDITNLMRYAVCGLENEISRCNEDVADNLCFIFDLKGFGLKNMDYAFTKRIIWIFHNCYPERLGVCLIVNAPWVFYGCWQMVRPWLNEVTASKMIFIENKEQLDDFVDSDKLPVSLFE